MDVEEQTCSPAEIPRLLLSRHAAAKTLDISVRLLDYAIASGLLETRRLNSRVLIPFRSLEKFAASDQIVPKISAGRQECA
jgi:hypothetical protein